MQPAASCASARPCNPSPPTSITRKRRIGRHELPRWKRSRCERRPATAGLAARGWPPWPHLFNRNSGHEETSLRSTCLRSLTRCLNRRLRRPLTRRCSRRTVRRVGRGPRVNYLAQALTAFNRAVRARCRLARLAPEIFDSAVVSRREAEREDRRQLMAELEPIIQKVYGPATDPPPEELHHAQTDAWCRNGAVFPAHDSGDRVSSRRAGIVDDRRRSGAGTTSNPPATLARESWHGGSARGPGQQTRSSRRRPGASSRSAE